MASAKWKGLEELSAALNKAFIYDSQVVMEENIDGFEVGCAVMGEGCLTVGSRG